MGMQSAVKIKTENAQMFVREGESKENHECARNFDTIMRSAVCTTRYQHVTKVCSAVCTTRYQHVTKVCSAVFTTRYQHGLEACIEFARCGTVLGFSKLC